jgi:hypothetical protein
MSSPTSNVYMLAWRCAGCRRSVQLVKVDGRPHSACDRCHIVAPLAGRHRRPHAAVWAEDGPQPGDSHHATGGGAQVGHDHHAIKGGA